MRINQKYILKEGYGDEENSQNAMVILKVKIIRMIILRITTPLFKK